MSKAAAPVPLILTLAFDEATFARLNDLRVRYFPRYLNFIPAHLTLFHKLQGEVHPVLRDAARVSAFEVAFTGVRSLGRGVALSVESPPLMALRSGLAGAFGDRLTPQDRQVFRPHVTIQNKVPPDQARALHDRLISEFRPFEGLCQGLLLWRYLGGPWELETTFPFED